MKPHVTLSKRIIALQIDPLETLNLQSDSSLLIAFEAQERGYRIFFYNPKDLAYTQGYFFACGHYLRLSNEGKFYTVEEEAIVDLSSVRALLIRQDPPFDHHYIANTYILELLEDHITILNSPRGIRAACEKTLPLLFPDFIPPTCISENVEILYKFSKGFDAVVIKPLFGHGGNGVLKLEKPTLFFLQTLTTLYKTSFPGPLVMQSYLPDVVFGDKRILLVNGDPVSIFKRVPKQGEIRANLVQGGVAEACDFTAKDLAICAAIKPKLRELGLYLVGLDIIGDYLMEINVTSPTGLRTANNIYNINIGKFFWDGLDDI
ncbi:MAG: glutathione synthase [Alphaproteobacteria bacterium]|nr:glutathione synthase [Alphaproteobacteria bacterium]